MQCKPFVDSLKENGHAALETSASLVFDNFHHYKKNQRAHKSNLINISYKLKTNLSFIYLSDKNS